MFEFRSTHRKFNIARDHPIFIHVPFRFNQIYSFWEKFIFHFSIGSYVKTMSCDVKWLSGFRVLCLICQMLVAILDFKLAQNKLHFVRDHLMIINDIFDSIIFLISGKNMFIFPHRPMLKKYFAMTAILDFWSTKRH